MTRKAAILLVAGMLAAWPARAAQHDIVDLQLVLAIDTSASIDEREFALQMAGIAAAFRDAEVVAAAQSGPFGRIAVSAMFWAESGYPKDETPWLVVHDAASAENFARMVEGWPRRIEGGTGIGHAVFKGVKMLEYNAFQSPRQVIDVSGDGKETTMREFNIVPTLARAMATGRGITVNGLVMLSEEEPLLDEYYWNEVVGGAGAFVVVARSIEDFARAMREKLLREITYRPVVSQAGHAPPPPS